MNLMVDELASYFVYVFLCCSGQWYWCFFQLKMTDCVLGGAPGVGCIMAPQCQWGEIYVDFWFNGELFPAYNFLHRWVSGLGPKDLSKSVFHFSKPVFHFPKGLQLQIFDFTMISMTLPRRDEWSLIFRIESPENTYQTFDVDMHREGSRYQIGWIFGTMLQSFYDRFGRIHARRYEVQIIRNACTWFPDMGSRGWG